MPAYWVSPVDSGIWPGAGGGRKGDGPGILRPSVTCKENSTLSPSGNQPLKKHSRLGGIKHGHVSQEGAMEGWSHAALKWRHHCTKNGIGPHGCHALGTSHDFSTESLQWLWISPLYRDTEAQRSLVICSRLPNKWQDTNIYNCQQRETMLLKLAIYLYQIPWQEKKHRGSFLCLSAGGNYDFACRVERARNGLSTFFKVMTITSSELSTSKTFQRQVQKTQARCTQVQEGVWRQKNRTGAYGARLKCKPHS